MYCPGKGNIPLSRLNQTNPKDSSSEKKDIVRYMTQESTLVTLTLGEIERESEDDPELTSTRQCIHSGDLSR